MRSLLTSALLLATSISCNKSTPFSPTPETESATADKNDTQDKLEKSSKHMTAVYVILGTFVASGVGYFSYSWYQRRRERRALQECFQSVFPF